MADRTLLHRNPSQTLLSLHVEVSRCGQDATGMISSLLSKARYLDLRYLSIQGFVLSDFLPTLPLVFTINTLRCLWLDFCCRPYYHQKLKFPSGINLTSLRSLCLELDRTDLCNLNQLLSELCSLENLHLRISGIPWLCVSSQTIRKLKLIITCNTRELDIELSLPSLVSLHLEILYCRGNLTYIHTNIPLLRKAVINLQNVHEKDASVVARLLNCISHVEDLSLHLEERTTQDYPVPILLKSQKNVPKFSNLKHLDATLSFHEVNLAAIIMMLHNCPILKSLKLVHKMPKFTGGAKRRKRKNWQSKLPHNADGDCCNVYFSDLHLEDNRKEFIKLLRERYL